jgi:hypothetical protein
MPDDTPDVDALQRRVAELEAELERWRTWRPPGHFYSPIPDLETLRPREDELFDCSLRALPGIDARVEQQLALMADFARLYRDQPWHDAPTDGRRYGFLNDQYSYSDAIFLFCMLRTARPARVIEVGSGHSSAAMLDTADLFLDSDGSRVDFTFIDPYPDRLHSVLRPEDHDRVRILDTPVQDVPLETFDALQANDVLFIDSTHVSKTGSDVNRLYFEVLPRLAPGVLVHIHDVHYPFEYPREWVFEGRAWNEVYLLRAFLLFNRGFEIVCMNTALEHYQPAWFREHMPLCLENPGGSIWLRRLPDRAP